MLGDVDTFDYLLALDLGKHLYEVRSLPNYEVMEWRAFYEVREALKPENMRDGRGS